MFHKRLYSAVPYFSTNKSSFKTRFIHFLFCIFKRVCQIQHGTACSRWSKEHQITCWCFALMCCFFSPHPLRSTLIQDIQKGNRGCDNTQLGAWNSPKSFPSMNIGDEREMKSDQKKKKRKKMHRWACRALFWKLIMRAGLSSVLLIPFWGRSAWYSWEENAAFFFAVSIWSIVAAPCFGLC